MLGKNVPSPDLYTGIGLPQKNFNFTCFDDFEYALCQFSALFLFKIREFVIGTHVTAFLLKY